MRNPRVKRKQSEAVRGPSIGLPMKGRPSLKEYSSEIAPAKITLRAVQTRMSKKAAKPTLPKMPWD